MLNATIKDLKELSPRDLGKLQRSLGQYLNTSQEKEARQLNDMIRDERDRRHPYGF